VAEEEKNLVDGQVSWKREKTTKGEGFPSRGLGGEEKFSYVGKQPLGEGGKVNSSRLPRFISPKATLRYSRGEFPEGQRRRPKEEFHGSKT